MAREPNKHDTGEHQDTLHSHVVSIFAVLCPTVAFVEVRTAHEIPSTIVRPVDCMPVLAERKRRDMQARARCV